VRAAAKLKDYPFYPAAQREFHFLRGRPAEAAKQFEKAMKPARSRSERSFFRAQVKGLLARCRGNQCSSVIE